MKLVKQAVVYTRVSTNEQSVEGVSLKMQESKARAYCHLNDLLIKNIFSDTASGKTSKRTGLQETTTENTHTHTKSSKKNEKSDKESVCVLNDVEAAAWDWAKDHKFWNGRITTVEQLRSNLEVGKAFRNQFEEETGQLDPTQQPVDGKKAKPKSKPKIRIKDCPYCNERGLIELISNHNGPHDILACPHDPEEVKQLVLKKDAWIGSAKPGYENPALSQKGELKKFGAVLPPQFSKQDDYDDVPF